MNCLSCGKSNRTERRFCSGCGVQWATPCSRCGFGNLPDEFYCGGCGIPLETKSNAATSEAISHPVQARPRFELSADAVKELQEIKEKANRPVVQESKSVSQEAIDQLFKKG